MMLFEFIFISFVVICFYRNAEVFSKRFLCNNNGFLQEVSENQVGYSNLSIFFCHPPLRMFEANFIPTFD